MRIKTALLMTLAAGVALAAAVSTPAVENRGADQITLHGGSRGDVSFPHHRHQKALEDCKICHDTFPQQAGAIDELKNSGDLKPKQVMNKLCTKCHRDRKQAGETSGPTTCTKCHQKG